MANPRVFDRYAPFVRDFVYEHELDALAEGDEGSAVFQHHVLPLQRHLGHYGREYVGAERLVRSASFIEVVGAGLARIGHVLASPFKR